MGATPRHSPSDTGSHHLSDHHPLLSTASVAHSELSRRLPVPTESTTPVPPTAASTMLRAEIAQSPWHVPPEHQMDGQSILRAIVARERRRMITLPTIHIEEMDSGLRRYNQEIRPPRYTAE